MELLLKTNLTIPFSKVYWKYLKINQWSKFNHVDWWNPKWHSLLEVIHHNQGYITWTWCYCVWYWHLPSGTWVSSSERNFDIWTYKWRSSMCWSWKVRLFELVYSSVIWYRLKNFIFSLFSRDRYFFVFYLFVMPFWPELAWDFL